MPRAMVMEAAAAMVLETATGDLGVMGPGPAVAAMAATAPGPATAEMAATAVTLAVEAMEETVAPLVATGA